MRSGLSASAGSTWSATIWRDELAAHGEVRVGEVVDLLREHFGDPVGPAAVAVRGFGLGVADPLGERVAERDVAPPRMVAEVRGCRACVIVAGGHCSSSVRDRYEAIAPACAGPSLPRRVARLV